MRVKKTQNPPANLDKKIKHFVVVGPMDFSWKALFFLGSPDETLLIFIDGGLKHRPKFAKKHPLFLSSSLTLGDGDSAPEAQMDIKKTTQEVSDLAFFLQKSKPLAKNAESFLFLGFLGGSPTPSNRLDHLLFNIGEIQAFRKALPDHKEILIKMDDKILFLSAGVHEVNIQGTFSFLCLETNQVRITGKCAYKVPKKTTLAPLSSKGLSNTGTGPVKIEASQAFFLILS